MAQIDPSKVLPKKAKVIARTDLVGVPEGTEGKVIIINGITWIRYWVRFANGVTLGSVNRSALATPEEWERTLAGEDEVVGSGAAGADSAGAGEDGESNDSDVTINGVLVPGKLIERAKAARARLAA